MGLFSTPKPEDYLPPSGEEIDSEKRYDLYLQHGENKLIVYTNIKIIGKKALPPNGSLSIADLLHIEQQDGTSVYLNTYSIFHMAESGTKVNFEIKSIDS